MRPFSLLMATLAACSQVSAKAVFAHFMLSNTLEFSTDEYAYEISVAQDAGIDAFAVNMGANDPSSDIGRLRLLFDAAESANFKIMFSFDYAGNGIWARDRVLQFIQTFAGSPSYFRRGEQPLVSTFEGSDNAGDWVGIKQETGCYFIPDYSSLGPQAALNTGVADGLFSWGAWPDGPRRMTTDLDEAYQRVLAGRDFMMPVSPWFYTNLPGYGKNWVWMGDNLWYDRWQQVLDLDPEYVQIITWNDFGEAHHIGPLNEKGYGPFHYGAAPFNYAADIPHDGWRKFLPYLIAEYKNPGSGTVSEEGVVAWYRLNPGSSCDSGGTVGNAASHGQTLYPVQEVLEDRIMFSALLREGAEVFVSVGGDRREAQWEAAPGGEGLYHGSVPFDGRTGEVVVTVSRGGSAVAEMRGAAITTDCTRTNGFNNWNAWVGSS